jgi:sialate O-acetylesterase
MSLLPRVVFLPSLLLLAGQASAAVALASPFTDHAVLQRERPVPFWGTADAGETVTITCGASSARAVTGADGRWKVELAPLPVGGPYEVTVSGSSTIVLKDVLVGDVWLCSGQSNMAFSLNRVVNHVQEVAQATHPKLRLFKVGLTAKEQPQSTCEGMWQVCLPTSAVGFSAVAYFFGRELNQELDVPTGLIDSAWGGTGAESWTSQPTLEASPEFRAVFPAWDKTVADSPKAMERYRTVELAKWEQEAAAAKAAGKPEPKKPREPNGPNTPHLRPAALYNGMIAPLVPYSLRGVIWYQGEANATGTRAEAYRRLLPQMVTGWRTAFGNEFPFYLVQIANFGPDQVKVPTDPWPVVPWAVLRESQALVATTLPKSGMAVAIDVGNPDDIHPTNKQEVGRRLALIALAKDYGKSVEYSGPVAKAMAITGKVIEVTFDHAHGLAAKDGDVQGFTIAGEDGRFRAAQAVINGSTVQVSCPEIAAPVSVRYAWGNSPTCNLVNQAGLPAGPFRFPEK